MSATPTQWRSGQKNGGLTYAGLGPGTTNVSNLSQENMAERDISHCPLSFTFAFEFINTGPHVHAYVYKYTQS